MVTNQAPVQFEIDWVSLKTRLKHMGRGGKLFFLILLVTVFNVTTYVPLTVSASGANMFLFWDPGSGYGATPPSPWNVVTSISGNSILGEFPMGEAPANFGTTHCGACGAMTRPAAPTHSTVVSAPIGGTDYDGGSSTPAAATTTHVHTAPATTVSTDIGPTNPATPDLPLYRTLELIEYGTGSSGIPTSIPAGAIAMFNVIPSSGWSPYSAENGKMIQINTNNPAVSGGNDTVDNTVTLPSTLSGTVSSTADVQPSTFLYDAETVASATHTHTISPTVGTTTAVSADPPYVQPLLGQATSSQPTIGVDLIGMFDADPGSGWSVLSSPGGPYNDQFLRPSSTYSIVSTGSTTHTDPNYVITTGQAVGTTTTYTLLGITGGGLIAPNHTHTVTVSFGSVSNIPPFFDVVIAQKVSFILNSYQWFVDNGLIKPTDAWPAGGVNLPPDTPLPVLPAAYRPPTVGNQLRLRIQIVVSGQNLAANSTGFELQYQQTSVGDCLSGTWTNLDPNGGPGTAVWRYGNDASLTDPDTLTSSTFSPASTVLELFSESATTAGTPTAASTGNTIEYDWPIQDFAATEDTEYHFRVIETDGTPLSLYTKVENGTVGTNECPDVTTQPGTDQEMRHGEFFQNDSDQGFEWAD
jgi:hypothetical protein